MVLSLNDAAKLVQENFKLKKKIIKNSNKELNFIYNIFSSITQRTHQSFLQGLIKQNNYNIILENIENLFNKYHSIQKPISFKTFLYKSPYKILVFISSIKVELIKIAQNSGTKKISHLFKLFFNLNINNNLILSNTTNDFLHFHNLVFSPISCVFYKKNMDNDFDNNIENKSIIIYKPNNIPFAFQNNQSDFDKNVLILLNENPISKKIDYNLNSFIMNIQGAKLFIPINNGFFVITGYYNEDPINLSRTYISYSQKENDLIMLAQQYNTPIEFSTAYIRQLSICDFVSLPNNTVIENCFKAYQKLKKLKQKTISALVKEFLLNNIEIQRETLTLLLLNKNNDTQSLAYLMYDMISNESYLLKPQPLAEQIFNSLHWSVQKLFKLASKKIDKLSSNILKFNIDKIPYEKRVLLIKCEQNIKNKIMDKVREINNSKGESNAKAMNYVEGALKIPFSIYKKEPIISFLQDFRKILKYFLTTGTNLLSKLFYFDNIVDNKFIQTYNSFQNFNSFQNITTPHIINSFIISTYNTINNINYNKKKPKNNYSNLNCNELKKKLQKYKLSKKGVKKKLIKRLMKYDLYTYNSNNKNFKKLLSNQDYISLVKKTNNIHSQWSDYKLNKLDYIKNVSDTLDNAVYGLNEAKNQIKRVIAQWIHGNMNGYVFGFEGPAGTGKCLAFNTPIIMFDGSIKKVQNIQINDLLMGDDSTPRKVLSTTSGKDLMFEIIQEYGNNYIVNSCHILSLKIVSNKPLLINNTYYNNEDIIDISIKDFMNLSLHTKKFLKGFKTAVEFQNTKTTTINSYILGYWLGNWNINNIPIYIKKTFNNNSIPNNYKYNTTKNRNLLLAGLIDSNGLYNKDKHSILLSCDNNNLANDITFLSRSLGYYTTISTPDYYNIITITIQGNLNNIPLKSLVINNKDYNHRLYTNISIKPLNKDNYYGFIIDGNHRFLLGDFTCTHNTTFAKLGIAKCLIDVDNNPRPFAFIALGGSSNGSTLEGHNYTYVGSTWGRIVDILMETKCMNPIIYIDELDKISRTEHGKEIVGILTHITDPSQNDSWCDKYFNGIKIDLSKVLFIFSYNDPQLIDKILLDRIHVIKTNALNKFEKTKIAQKFLLKKIYTSVGFNENDIIFPENIIHFIIETYTYEAGVRKFKERLFELVREINLQYLLGNTILFPFTITLDFVKKTFEKKSKITIKSISKYPKIGIVNGLFATASGLGGITIIESFKILANNKLTLELTGQQGDVMKESMKVAKTVVWNLLPTSTQNFIRNNEPFGIHIHCPEAATPKDGPSAGCAITIAILSLLLNIPVLNTIALTGEIDLNGSVLPIGGLESKIFGAKKAGVKTVLIPHKNIEDLEKIRNSDYPPEDNNFKVISVKHISQIIKYMLIISPQYTEIFNIFKLSNSQNEILSTAAFISKLLDINTLIIDNSTVIYLSQSILNTIELNNISDKNINDLAIFNLANNQLSLKDINNSLHTYNYISYNTNYGLVYVLSKI